MCFCLGTKILQITSFALITHYKKVPLLQRLSAHFRHVEDCKSDLHLFAGGATYLVRRYTASAQLCPPKRRPIVSLMFLIHSLLYVLFAGWLGCRLAKYSRWDLKCRRTNGLKQILGRSSCRPCFNRVRFITNDLGRCCHWEGIHENLLYTILLFTLAHRMVTSKSPQYVI